MPNTLAHIGVNGLISRALISKAELPLVYLGCVIPDLPWILQRIVRIAAPSVSGYDLRVYVVTQASLLLSLIISAAIAACFKKPTRAFGILALGSLLHLLLDTVEVKWANGAGFFIPFDWKLVQLNWLWPEHSLISIITLAGLFYFIWKARTAMNEIPALATRPLQWCAAAALLCIYFAFPVFMQSSGSAADIHYVNTLRSVEQRSGRYVEFDRVPYALESGTARLQTLAGEWLEVRNVNWTGAGSVSLRARFLDNHSLLPIESSIHNRALRDSASYIGLGLILATWVAGVWINLNRGKLRTAHGTRR